MLAHLEALAQAAFVKALDQRQVDKPLVSLELSDLQPEIQQGRILFSDGLGEVRLLGGGGCHVSEDIPAFLVKGFEMLDVLFELE